MGRGKLVFLRQPKKQRKASGLTLKIDEWGRPDLLNIRRGSCHFYAERVENRGPGRFKETGRLSALRSERTTSGTGRKEIEGDVVEPAIAGKCTTLATIERWAKAYRPLGFLGKD